jgi:hypothetical protein
MLSEDKVLVLYEGILDDLTNKYKTKSTNLSGEQLLEIEILSGVKTILEAILEIN